MNIKKLSYFFVVLAVVPVLCAFQADTPGDNFGFVGGGGQNLYEVGAVTPVYVDYWYFNIPYRHVFNNGNMSVGAVFTFMQLYQQTASHDQINSVASEFRLTPYWSHNPSRYFGYDIGVYFSYADYSKINCTRNYPMPSVAIRTGALDMIYFSLGVFHPDLAGDVSGLLTAQIVFDQKLIPYTQLSAGVGWVDGVPMIDINWNRMKWYGIVPMFSVKVQPTKLLSIVASLKMSGEQIWNVSSGMEFHF